MTTRSFPSSPSSVHARAARFAEQLQADGYVVIRHAADPALIDELNMQTAGRFAHTPFSRGSFYGERTKRFGKLLTRAPRAVELVQNELILAIMNRVLVPSHGCLQLNLTQALEMHPGSQMQIPHRDDSIWDGPRLPGAELSVNVMWPFTPYTRENGATNLWPGSHRHQEVLLADAESIDVEMEPGAALLYVGSILHRGGENRTNMVRRGLIVGYAVGWVKPYENPWLAYPPDVARHFPADLAKLIGYRQDQPNLNNYDGQCPSILLRGDAPDHLGAVDELRPDQLEMIRRYRSGELKAA